MSSLIIGLVLHSSAAAHVGQEADVLYSLDETWNPQLPHGAHTISAVDVAYPLSSMPVERPATSFLFVSQRGNTSIDPILVMDASDGSLVSSWGKEHVGMDTTTNPSAPTWGSHGLAVESCRYRCGTGTDWHAFHRVYIDDFTNHTLTAFSYSGDTLFQLGTNGANGTSKSPLQFGNIADTAIQSSACAALPVHLYSSDGDGGSANRVVKVAVTEGKPSLEWVTDSIYNNPHSVAYHEGSNLLIVADRDHNETRLLRASDGQDLGSWNCGLHLGTRGKPFGVRTLKLHRPHCDGDLDLVVLAIMDNPQDGFNQKLVFIDAKHLSSETGASSQCTVLQSLAISTKFSGPHLLGVDKSNGDVYAALVSDHPLSTVLRFRPRECRSAANVTFV